MRTAGKRHFNTTTSAGQLTPQIQAVRTAIEDQKRTATLIVPKPMRDSSPSTCDEPFADAMVVKIASLVYPVAARAVSATGVVYVKVLLDATGAVADARVYKSSGNIDLDMAAVSAARATTYRPGRFLCRPTAGAYIFVSQFTGTVQRL